MIFRMAAVLTTICIVSALALSVVYDATHERIEERRENELYDKIESVFGEGVEVEEIPATPYSDNKGVYQSFNVREDGDYLGKAFVIDYPGYQGSIRLLAGVRDGKVLGLEILSHTETPGLGARIEEPAFRDQFINQDPERLDADTITGATISSEAVINAVKEYANE